MDAGLHPLTSIHVHNSNAGTSVHAMETLKQFGVVLPYMASVRDFKTNPSGVKKLVTDLGMGYCVKVSLTSGASFLVGVDQEVMLAEGGTVRAINSIGAKLHNGLPNKMAWSDAELIVERVEQFPDPLGLARVEVHGYENIVLGCGVVAVWS